MGKAEKEFKAHFPEIDDAMEECVKTCQRSTVCAIRRDMSRAYIQVIRPTIGFWDIQESDAFGAAIREFVDKELAGRCPHRLE